MKKLKVFGLCFMAVVILSMSGIEPVFAKHRNITIVNDTNNIFRWIAGRVSGVFNGNEGWGDILPAGYFLESGQAMTFSYDDANRYHDILVMNMGLKRATFLKCDLNSAKRLIIRKRKYNGRFYLDKE